MLYSTARELLAKIVRHASAREVNVRLEVDHGDAVLTVTDDGVGIDPDEMQRKLRAGHIGISSHRARVDAAGGRFALTRRAGGGTVAVVRIPVRHLPAADDRAVVPARWDQPAMKSSRDGRLQSDH